MAFTEKDETFLWAVARDTLPRYNSLGALHRAANRLIRAGLLASEPAFGGDWTRYSLTEAGRTALRDTGSARQERARRAEDAELHRRNLITG